MKQFKSILGLAIGLLFITNTFAQDSQTIQKQVDNQKKFAMVGYATANYRSEGGNGGFTAVTFNPIFVYKVNDRLSFDAEIEFEVEDEWDGAVGLEFAELAYELNNNMTFYAGKFLSPLGAYQERSHPAWINRSINNPVGIMTGLNGLKQLQSMAEIGMGVKGGFYSGDARFNYNVFVSNGPNVNDDGSVEWENLEDNNNAPAIGGRVGILPFANSTFELGFSGYTGRAGDKSAYSNVKVNVFMFDLNYVKQTAAGRFDIKGQYNIQHLTDATYPDTQVAFQSFNNNSSAKFIQLAYRFPNSKLEFVNRIANLNVPNEVVWGGDQTRYTTTLNYWLNWNAVIKVGLDIVNNDANGFGVTFAMGL